MQINLQNSAASAVHVNNLTNQVQSLTARIRDLETAMELINPIGPWLDDTLDDLKVRVVALENRAWSLPRIFQLAIQIVKAKVRRLHAWTASCCRRARRWVARDASEDV